MKVGHTPDFEVRYIYIYMDRKCDYVSWGHYPSFLKVMDITCASSIYLNLARGYRATCVYIIYIYISLDQIGEELFEKTISSDFTSNHREDRAPAYRSMLQ